MEYENYLKLNIQLRGRIIKVDSKINESINRNYKRYSNINTRNQRLTIWTSDIHTSITRYYFFSALFFKIFHKIFLQFENKSKALERRTIIKIMG